MDAMSKVASFPSLCQACWFAFTSTIGDIICPSLIHLSFLAAHDDACCGLYCNAFVDVWKLGEHPTRLSKSCRVNMPRGIVTNPADWREPGSQKHGLSKMLVSEGAAAPSRSSVCQYLCCILLSAFAIICGHLRGQGQRWTGFGACTGAPSRTMVDPARLKQLYAIMQSVEVCDFGDLGKHSA